MSGSSWKREEKGHRLKQLNKNIKSLRLYHKLTQGQFADAIDVKRSAIGAYEEGRADPRLSIIAQISEYFSITVDELVLENLDQLLNQGIRRGTALRVVTTEVTPAKESYVPWIPEKAAAGYSNGYSDPEFIAELPKFVVPQIENADEHRAFEIIGDSMLPLPSGTKVICKKTSNYQSIRSGQAFIVVTAQDGFLYKRIDHIDLGKRLLTLTSDNPHYKPFQVGLGEVLEVWEARHYISSKLPTPPNPYEEKRVNELARRVEYLDRSVAALRATIRSDDQEGQGGNALPLPDIDVPPPPQ